MWVERGATSANRYAASTTGSTSARFQHTVELGLAQETPFESSVRAASRPSRTTSAAEVFTW